MSPFPIHPSHTPDHVILHECLEPGGLRDGGGSAPGVKPGGIAAFHTTDQGDTAVNRDHCLRRAGPPVPDPVFATKIPAGRRASCPAPIPPGGQPDPRRLVERSSVGPLR